MSMLNREVYIKVKKSFLKLKQPCIEKHRLAQNAPFPPIFKALWEHTQKIYVLAHQKTAQGGNSPALATRQDFIITKGPLLPLSTEIASQLSEVIAA